MLGSALEFQVLFTVILKSETGETRQSSEYAVEQNYTYEGYMNQTCVIIDENDVKQYLKFILKEDGVNELLDEGDRLPQEVVDNATDVELVIDKIVSVAL